MRFLLLAVTAVLSCGADAANTASGRNWRLAIESLECQGALLVLGARIGYLGPHGPVEAPLIRVVDAQGMRHPPRSVVWKQGAKPIADWLSGGGLTNLQSENLGEVQLRFPVPEAGGELRLEFGDIAAFTLTRSGCARLPKPEALKVPHTVPVPLTARAPAGQGELRVYRDRYPCMSGATQRTIEAGFPPYLPRRLLFFGHGYLPSAREIELPMGRAVAQSYRYGGADELGAVEAVARYAAAMHFPEYAPPGHFAFNWGVQQAASGNAAYAVGIYDLRSCPGK